mmetsp:Transcript_13415/g.37673  ORF Transcript_13415/g.37673 Transcript_13415/m.37673 type:complete len:236 (+) Transcript_13415:1316-2023(+)
MIWLPLLTSWALRDDLSSALESASFISAKESCRAAEDCSPDCSWSFSVLTSASFSLMLASKPATFISSRLFCFSAPCFPESNSRLLCFRSLSESLRSFKSPSRDSTLTPSSLDLASRENFSSCKVATLCSKSVLLAVRASFSALNSASMALFSASYLSLNSEISLRSSCLQSFSRLCFSVSHLEVCSLPVSCSLARASVACLSSPLSLAVVASSAFRLDSRADLAALTSLRRCER